MERNDSLRVFTKDKGFVFANGKLQEVKWLRTDYKLDHSELNDVVCDECGRQVTKDVKQLFYHATTTYVLPDGTTGKLEECYGGFESAFDSVENYEKGITAETSYRTLYAEGEQYSNVICDVFRNKRHSGYKPKYWRFDDTYHVAVEETLDLEKFYFDYADNSFHSDSLYKGEIYESKEDALSYNTYKVVKQDGTEFQRDGVNKLIMLDDDQRKLVGQLEKLFQKMRDSGMLLLLDCSENLQAYNLRNIERYNLNYEGSPKLSMDDDTDPDDYEMADRYGKGFSINHKIDCYGDDYNLFILRKKEDNNDKTE